MSKDVPIYVHHMKPRFGQEIRNNFLSQVCHVYSLYCNLRVNYESTCGTLVSILHKYVLEKYFCFAPIQYPQENSPKTALKPKRSHFSLLFCQKVIFN